MINILRAILNRNRMAEDLLTQIKFEKHEKTPKALVAAYGSSEGYLWVQSGRITFLGYYLTPKKPIKEIQMKLEELKEAIEDIEDSVVVASLFSAKAVERAMTRVDSRGR